MHDLVTRRVLRQARARLEDNLPDRADVRRTVTVASPTGGTTKAPRIVATDMPCSWRAGGGGITVTAEQAETVTFLDGKAPVDADVKRGDELIVYPDGDRERTPAVVRVVSIIAPDSLALLQRINARAVVG